MAQATKRKVVQITSMGKDCVMALCDDGSLWKLEFLQRMEKDNKWVWTPIKMSGPDDSSSA